MDRVVDDKFSATNDFVGAMHKDIEHVKPNMVKCPTKVEVM